MSYADQKMSGGKIAAIVVVALIHIALGYAFITGLAYQYVKKASEKLNTFDVAPPPPPPPDIPPPPPPPEQPNLPPPPTTVVTPPPIIRTPVPAPVIQTTTTIPPRQTMAPPSPPAPPAPPAVKRVSQAAGLKGNPGQFFSDDAYPASAIRDEAQGRVSARLSIGTDGRVTDCSVTSSSGNSALDDTTCRIAKARVRFTPAKDQDGNPIASTYPLNVTWKLPKE